MAAADRVLRAAEEFEATAKRHGLAAREEFTDFLQALEIGVSRIYGEGLYQLMRRSDVQMIREIHSAIMPKASGSSELEKLARAVVDARYGDVDWEQLSERIRELAEITGGGES